MSDHRVREPAVAGTFYPDDPEELKQMVDGFISKAPDIELDGKLRGLVVPHAGYAYSGPVAACGYRLLGRYRNTREIWILGPSHYAAFQGACMSGHEIWRTPLGGINTLVLDKKPVVVYPKAHEQEHCLEVQLPFIQTVLEEIRIGPILCGNVNPHEMATVFAECLGESSIVIASSDLSHYLAYDEAVKRDNVANLSVPSLDIARFERFGDACGKTAILSLMHIAKIKGWKGRFLDYKNSGDTAGPKSRVVGYGCYAFYEED